MKNTRYELLLFCTIIVRLNVVYSQVEWVDPFNMNRESSHHQNECTCDVPVLVNDGLSHYRRSINLLLSSVAVDRTDPLNYKGILSISIPTDSYDYLRQFTKHSQEDPLVLQKVDHILTNIFMKPTAEQMSDVFLSWADYLYFTFFTRATGICLSALFITFISYKLLKANWTLWLVIKYLVLLSWIVDFTFTWVHLLQESEINKIADSLRYEAVPPHCDPKKMSYFQYLWAAFSTEDECRNYHKVMLREIFWSIGPFTVFAHQFGQVVLTPASYLGSAVANFTKGLMGSMVWPLNIFLLPILLLFTLVLVCIILSFLTKTTFKVNLFHLLQFSFGSDDRKILGDFLSGGNLMKLLEAVTHRSMIEDVRENKSSRKQLKQSKNIKESKVISKIVSSDNKDRNEKKNKRKKIKNIATEDGTTEQKKLCFVKTATEEPFGNRTNIGKDVENQYKDITKFKKKDFYDSDCLENASLISRHSLCEDVKEDRLSCNSESLEAASSSSDYSDLDLSTSAINSSELDFEKSK